MPYMLDTDTCIFIMNRDPRIAPQASLAECAISQIVLGELEYGVANSPEARQLENSRSLLDFLSSIKIYALTNQTARVYGEVRAGLRRSGQSIGPNDLWIAAHALALELPLVTNNTREFSRVPELVINTWVND